MNNIDIYFIRHGNYFHMNDDSDCTLTYSGQQQARKTGEQLIEQLQRPIYIYSSTLTRVKQTRDILLHDTDFRDDIRVEYSDAFREVGLNRNPSFVMEENQFAVSSAKNNTCIIIYFIQLFRVKVIMKEQNVLYSLYLLTHQI